jgi:hypothetical protein
MNFGAKVVVFCQFMGGFACWMAYYLLLRQHGIRVLYAFPALQSIWQLLI